MSPVHVMVGQDPRAAAKWADAFNGAVDLYSFDRNVDAFERLTAAQAPIDLVILTPAQDGPFNLTPDQFIARVLDGPLAHAPMLANLHVIVVGSEITRAHPRAIALRSLDAAIRLVKFGEVESAPRPAPVARPAQPATRNAAPAHRPSADGSSVSGSFSGGVISRIWDAADAADAAERSRNEVPSPASPAATPAKTAPVRGGGGAQHARLFAAAPARSSASVILPSSAPAAAAPSSVTAATVAGGGPIAALANVMSVQDEPASGLQPVLPYKLPNGAGYRGPSMRGGQIPAASHIESSAAGAAMSAAPVPPALGSQVQSMVYGGPPMRDPLLSWSGGGTSTPVAAPLPTTPLHAPSPVSAPAPAAASAPAPPMDPPAGVYGGMPAGLLITEPAAATASADPFLQRAEQSGGATFG